MAKRKAGVNDIIYELDNDDSELSSEDEVKQSKIIRIDEINSPHTTQSDTNTQSSGLEVIDIDSSTEKFDETHSPKVLRNGGKSPVEFIIIDEISETTSPRASAPITRDNKFKSDTIFNEDIIIDSPASYSDPGVVGCENRTPLITVKFRDSRLAMNYKKQIKTFMLNLIKLHENTTESDNETDLELDIWPEDLEDYNDDPEKPEDDLFFVDTDPGGDKPIDIPCYSQNTPLICNAPEKELSPPPMAMRKGPTCFNCNGSHTMRDCREPWNNARIAENRKAMVRKGRYHVEDEQKYGHLVPGRISGKLRHALGLKRDELPLHIYHMRHMGYPPGWLEEARISHSGITLFDSSGQATLDPEDEEGELCEPGAKDKYDIKKILDFPGFNVLPSARYKEQGHALGLPPMSDADSKLAMLAVLAPNAMQAYKRKKLLLCPEGAGTGAERLLAGTAEMDIDSGDEIAEFPSQPPLPDDAPPPPPPPPDTPPPPAPKSPPPPPEEPEKPSRTDKQHKKGTKDTAQANPEHRDSNMVAVNTESDDDLEVVGVMQVADIPVPFADMITIDVDGDVSEPESGCPSPSLDDLERKKRLLLDALGTAESKDTVMTEPIGNAESVEANTAIQTDSPSNMEVVEKDDGNDKVEDGSSEKTVDIDKAASDKVNEEVVAIDIPESMSDKSPVESTSDQSAILSTSSEKPVVESTLSVEDAKSSVVQPVENTTSDNTKVESTSSAATVETSTDKSIESTSTDKPSYNPTAGTSALKNTKEIQSTNDMPKTPTSNMGLVRSTDYGTPVINVASPYIKLPSDDKFSKDICDVINFENLPNSIGKYKKMSTILMKVKSEVERIQES